jgi:DNA-binding transcriptional regulator/RsmH inhibitor MraZ
MYVYITMRHSRLKYPEPQFDRRNDELHALIRSVPPSDVLLDTFPSALQKGELSIQGRVYITQMRICFYSNILNSVTTVCCAREMKGVVHDHQISLFRNRS